MTLPRDASRFWKFLYRLITLLRPLFCTLQVEGRHHVPTQGGCVLVCNHSMGPDYVVLGYASPRQVYYMAKMEIFAWHPLLTKVLVAVGVFPVHRGQSDLGAIQGAVDLVRNGHVVGMFPEGTRSRTGKLQRGKSGAVRIAMHAGAPVVPAVVLNAHQVVRGVGRWWPRPTVIVRFGKPIYLSGDAGDSQNAHDNTEKVMAAMAALLPPELRGEYIKLDKTDQAIV
ncbi:MAG: 1-acyl-sn-glycerol-3-phosphate acyltransferase [Chloroflexota bacterium]|nr:1-acyl-sn-glycerol-3-phosphate acyltransferase [Chloroflexota bacterium]